jgi:hypothetical protein
MGRRIGRRNLVEHLRIWFESHEAVRKPHGDKELTPVFRGELNDDMSPERWGGPPDVDRDVEDTAADDAYELVLRERRRLEVEATQCAD